MHHRAHHIQHYHHNNYRNSELFRKIQKTKRNIPFFVLSFSKSSGKIQIFSAKADFLGLVLLRKWKKKTPSFSANLTVGLFVYLRKKGKLMREKKNEEKKIKTEENCCSQLFQILLRLFFDFVKNSVILATLLLKLLSTTLHTT